MKISKRFFGAFTCFFLLLFTFAKSDSLAVCPPDAVKVAGYAYTAPTIQAAYDHASKPVIEGGMGLSGFTLQLLGQIFTEDLTLDGGAVVLDGGYDDCTFTTKTSPSSVFGTITIKSGTLNVTAGTEAPRVVSTDQCDFDIDLDGYTRIGSCAGSADDCNDNDFAINPGASEICDGLDNNCDGQIDEGLTGTDADGDGYYAIGSCGAVADDCNDSSAAINPGAVEIPYDGIDQDCNGADLTFTNGNACADCHVPDDALDGRHSYRPSATDPTCVLCHAGSVSSILSGHYGRIVRTTDNNVPAGSTINCWTCHDNNNHSGGGSFGDGNGDVWNDVSPPYPGNYTCDNCHANRSARHATATAHNNRIIDSSCANCHTSDTTVLGSPGSGTLASAADVDALHGVVQATDCALCHAYSGTLLDASVVRQTISQGLSGTQVSCLNCHTDKGTNHGGVEHPIEVGPNDLSYDAPGQPCSDCHVVANWTEIEGTEHNVDTNGAGSCATCHNSPRQAVIDAIALGADPTHCLDCHADKELTVHGSVDHVASGDVIGGTTYCLDCHDDPVQDPNWTVDITHGGDCTLCHTTVPDLQPGVPLGGGDCVTCHTVTWQVLHMNNPPDHSSLVTTLGTNNCASCHADALIDASTHLADCSNCHNASDGTLVATFGTNNQTFAAGGNCETCHSQGWKPIHLTNTPDHNSLVQVDATSCADCHSDPPPLVDAHHTSDPKVHDSCDSCHNSDGSRVTLYDTNLQTFIVGGDCTTCHTTGFDTIHATSHAHTIAQGAGDLSFEAPGTPCSDCHVVANWAEIEGTEHNVATNGAGSCSTCHNSPRQEVIDAIALGADPTNCLDCHSNKNLTVHGNTDHVANADVTLATACDDCHDDSAQGANWTVDVTHSADCTFCHTTVPDMQPGVPAGPADCSTCHSAAWNVTHTAVTPDHSALVTTLGTDNCASCHADALIDASSHLSDCSNCHNADGSRVATYNTHLQTFAAGGNCETCHTLGWETTHFDNNNGTSTHNSLVQVASTDCADCHVDPPPLTDVADNQMHNACDTCHNANGSLVTTLGTNNQDFTTGGDCTTCHGNSWGPLHPAPPDHSSLVTTATTDNCASCHADALIDATTHLSDCSNCHDANGALISSAIGKTFSTGGNCETCHSAGWESTHFDNNNGTTTHNALVQVAATTCGNCHSDPPPLTDIADVKVHSTCGTCHTANGSLHLPLVGLNFTTGGDCTTCHGTDWGALHPTTPDHSSLVTTLGTDNCASCHADALIDASTHLANCSNCHNADGSLVATNGTDQQTFAVGGNCESCHDTGWESTHFNNNNTTTTHNTLVQVDTTSCGSCHSDPPPLTDNADNEVHNACGTCHTANGTLVTTLGTDTRTFAIGGNCTTCHGTDWGGLHPTTPDHSSLVTTTGTDNCASCHADALIDASTHLANCSNCHNADGTLVTTNNTDQQTFAVGGNCETCHDAGWESTHFNNNNTTTTHNTLVQVDTTSCGSCHSDPPPLTDNADNEVHNACGSCHTANGTLVTTLGTDTRTFAIGGNCTTCHGTDWGALHPTTPDHSSLVTTAGTDNCASCHANALIDTSTHLSNCSNCHNADGTLVTTNNTDQQTFAVGGNCETCHDAGWESTHFNNNNTTTTHNTLVQVDTTSCGSCHSDPPPLTDNADNEVHNACGSCHTANGDLQSIAVGQDFTTGGNCTTCHGTDWGGLHPTTPDHSSLVTTAGTDNCASCHANALIDASTHLANCSNCHNADGSLVTTFGTNNQTFAAGGNCETCHNAGWESTHFANNNGFTTHNTLVTVAGTTAGWTNCGSCHSDPPPLTDNADAKVHDLCLTCHNANGSRVPTNGTNNQDFATGGNCETCHGIVADSTTFATTHPVHTASHTVALGAGDLSSGSSCGDCHVVANWTEIESTEHNVTTNGAGSCATCHNSARAEVITAISTGANPTNCLDCHSDKTVAHGSPDHMDTAGGTGYVLLGGTGLYYDTTAEYVDCADNNNINCKTCADCHDPGGAANATVDVTHSGNCSLCHTTVPNLQPGVPAGGGDCVTCHTPSQHTLWTRYMDTCSRQNGGAEGQPGIACHPGFNNGPGNSLHDVHNPAGGWADRDSATSGMIYPFATRSEMWIPEWPLNPTCNTCHTAPDDGTSGAGCGACHTFPGKGPLHDIHAGKKAGEQDIECALCHWNS